MQRRHSQPYLFFEKCKAAVPWKRRWWPGGQMRSCRSITPFCMTSGGVDLPQLLAGAAWSQSEGLQENRNMMQNDLLERLEFRTSIAVTLWRWFWITSDIRYDVRSTENTGPEFQRSGCAVQRSQESELWVTGGGRGVPWSARQCTVWWERTKLSLRSYSSD